MVLLSVARIRSPIFFVLASIAMHWGVGRTLRARPPPSPVANEPLPIELEIDSQESTSSAAASEGRASSEEVKPEARSTAARAPSPAVRPDRKEAMERPETEPSSEAIAAPANSGGEKVPSPLGSAWSFNPLAGRSSLAIESHGHEVTASEKAEKEAREATTTFKSEMYKEMDKLGRTKGIRYSGPFLRAIETAMRSHDAPLEGTLRWTVTYGSDGSVSISDEHHSNKWAKIEQAIRENLKRRNVKIPVGANGYQVVIESEASLRFPNGMRASEVGASVGGPEFNAQIVEEKRTDESGATVKGDTVGSAQATLVKVSLRGKVCSAHLRVGPKAGVRQTQEGINSYQFSLFDLGGGCDPSMIGVHPERVVRMRVIDEGRTE